MTTNLHDLPLDDLLPEKTQLNPIVTGVGGYKPPQARHGTWLESILTILEALKPRDVFLSILLMVGAFVMIHGLQQGWLQLPRRQTTQQAVIGIGPIPASVPLSTPQPLPLIIEVTRIVEVTRVVVVPQPQTAPPMTTTIPPVGVMAPPPPAQDRFFCFVDPNGVSGSTPLRVEAGLFMQVETRGISPNMEVTVTDAYGGKRTWRRCRYQGG